MSRGAARSVLLVLAWTTSLGACVPIPAWDRERLAHPAMRDAAHAECAGFDAHVRAARESALEPATAGGGGCGCN